MCVWFGNGYVLGEKKCKKILCLCKNKTPTSKIHEVRL